jgi:hypothetical protein
MITIIYSLVDKLMEPSHTKLVQHIVLMQTVFSAPLMQVGWGGTVVGSGIFAILFSFC